MIAMQRDELGGQVEFTGQDLADIIAFLHHQSEQEKFSEADIPPDVKAIMAKMEDAEDGGMKDMNMKPKSGEGEN